MIISMLCTYKYKALMACYNVVHATDKAEDNGIQADTVKLKKSTNSKNHNSNKKA